MTASASGPLLSERSSNVLLLLLALKFAGTAPAVMRSRSLRCRHLRCRPPTQMENDAATEREEFLYAPFPSASPSVRVTV